MLYYIIPPIIIIISTSVLIYFLFRKAEQLPSLETKEVDLSEKNESIFFRIKEIISHGWLKLMERLMHRAKLISLKFHNISNERFHAIRKKRQERVDQEQEKDAIIAEIREENSRGDNAARNVVQLDGALEPHDKEPKSLIKPTIVHPDIRQTKMVAKSQLEDALIKRIAVNPRDIEAYERLGDYYMETSNQKDALECFKQVLKLNPQHHKAKLRVRRIEKAMV
jgi:thioredoxin-like negative regulator of GroEL